MKLQRRKSKNETPHPLISGCVHAGFLTASAARQIISAICSGSNWPPNGRRWNWYTGRGEVINTGKADTADYQVHRKIRKTFSAAATETWSTTAWENIRIRRTFMSSYAVTISQFLKHFPYRIYLYWRMSFGPWEVGVGITFYNELRKKHCNYAIIIFHLPMVQT